MEGRKAFELKNTLLVYNLIQVSGQIELIVVEYISLHSTLGMTCLELYLQYEFIGCN